MRLTFCNLLKSWGAAGAMYCEWYAMFATFTLFANTPSRFSCSTNLLIFSVGPDSVLLLAELWQATAIPSGSESLISLYPFPECVHKRVNFFPSSSSLRWRRTNQSPPSFRWWFSSRSKPFHVRKKPKPLALGLNNRQRTRIRFHRPNAR